jgi:hypothetical protein
VIAAACGSTVSALTAHYLATDSILIGGDDTLRARYLPAAAEGALLGAFALTEPAAGSDPADMKTSAARRRRLPHQGAQVLHLERRGRGFHRGLRGHRPRRAAPRHLGFRGRQGTPRA